MAIYDDRVQRSPAARSVGVTKRTALRTPDYPSVQGTANTGQCHVMSCHVMSGKREYKMPAPSVSLKCTRQNKRVDKSSQHCHSSETQFIQCFSHHFQHMHIGKPYSGLLCVKGKGVLRADLNGMLERAGYSRTCALVGKSLHWFGCFMTSGLIGVCIIQTQKGSKRHLFILAQTHSVHIFREIPFIKPQNDT